MHAFIINFKKVMFIRSTLLSIFMTFGLCFFSHIIGSPNSLTHLELAVKILNGEKMTNSIFYQDIICWYDNSFWFYIVLPVILSLPAISDFCAEWFSGSIYLNISRQGITKYTVSKSCAYSLCSLVCFVVGIFVFILIVILIFPKANFEYINKLYPNGFWVCIFSRIMNSASVVTIYPLICIVSVIIIKERFLSLSVPLLINYITAQIGNNLYKKMLDSGNMNYEKIAAVMPYMQTTQYENFERLFNLPMVVWYLIWLGLIICFIFFFHFLVKARIKYNG